MSLISKGLAYNFETPNNPWNRTKENLDDLSENYLINFLLNTDITPNNYEDYKNKINKLIELVKNNPVSNDTIIQIQTISKKFFNVVLIKNILLELYNLLDINPTPNLSDILKIHKEKNGENPAKLDNTYFAELVIKTKIMPNIENMILEDDEVKIITNLQIIMQKAP